MFRRADGRRFRATALSLAVAASVAGCSQPGPRAYDEVNAVVEQLSLRTVGQALYTGEYGGDAAGGTPTEVMVFNGTGARATVEARMHNLGYTAPTSADGWWVPPAPSPVVVVVVDLPPGATYPVGPRSSSVVHRHATEVLVQDRGVRRATPAPTQTPTATAAG